MSIITGYNSHFEVHVTTMTSQHSVPIKGPLVHTCLVFYLAVIANYLDLCYKYKMSNNQDNATAKAITGLPRKKLSFHKEPRAEEERSHECGDQSATAWQQPVADRVRQRVEFWKLWQLLRRCAENMRLRD